MPNCTNPPHTIEPLLNYAAPGHHRLRIGVTGQAQGLPRNRAGTHPSGSHNRQEDDAIEVSRKKKQLRRIDFNREYLCVLPFFTEIPLLGTTHADCFS